MKITRYDHIVAVVYIYMILFELGLHILGIIHGISRTTIGETSETDDLMIETHGNSTWNQLIDPYLLLDFY